jgi:aminoglycoside phosphotransferase
LVQAKELQLPQGLRRLIKGSDFAENTLGCSSAVVLHVKDKNSYLKIAPYNEIEPLAYEAAVLEWLEGKLPVPKVHYYERWQDKEYLLISEIPGIDCSSEVHRAVPEAMVRSLAEGLQLMHSLDITGCPFDQTIQVKLEKARLNIERGLVDAENLEDEYLGQDPRELYGLVLATKPTVEDLVFTHGDYCFPNVIVHDGKLSGFIDLGRAGVSDRYQDLALAVRSFRHNSYSEKWVEFFLEVYGVERLDQAKIDFFILLDEFF